MSVQAGPEAPIGAYIEIGRCLTEKKPSSQSETTIMAFIKQPKWASGPKGGMNIPSGVNKAGQTAERTIMGKSNTASTNTEKNNSGITALLWMALFLHISYSPTKTAEKALRYNHILLHQIITGRYKRWYFYHNRISFAH